MQERLAIRLAILDGVSKDRRTTDRTTKNIISRRGFIGASLAAPIATSFPATAMQRPSDGKLARLACNSWPFRAYFDTPQMHDYRDAKYPLLTQADFPQFLADTFGIHNVEFLPQHFTDTEPATIERIKVGLNKARSRCCNLMGVEFPGGVFSHKADKAALSREAERWANVAIALGAPSITVALTGSEQADPRTASYNLAPVVDVAHRHGLKVLFHNDDIRRESAEILTYLVTQLGRERTGTCPDFGNFATRSAEFALTQLRMLAPYAANICHAKDGIAEKGKFYPDDFPGSMKVMQQARFQGIYSLEYEGLDAPVDGVRKLIRLVEASLS